MKTKNGRILILATFLLILAFYGYQAGVFSDYLHLLNQLSGKDLIVAAAADDNKRVIHSPELDGGLGWFNVARPLTLRNELKGKIVLLDFWTYCCINCMHVIPQLKILEKKYEKELVVIGVHSAKFNNEKDSQNIRTAVLRYEIEHPVVNDANFSIWSSYGINSWPTMVLIDPEGRIVGSVSGESQTETLDRAISELIHKFQGKINTEPIPLALEKDKEPEPVLSFPGKIIADNASGRLFISDSNHNRIIISNFTGNVLDVIGDGLIGCNDGSYNKAQFHHPQGMALDGENLYVADTENHLLRRIQLKNKKVETVAGTGKQTYNWKGGEGVSAGLNSPWDVVNVGKAIYIANAGQHQIWAYYPENGMVEPFAGSGRENIQDGSIKNAQLAQPSGLTTDGTDIYFADSEVSALRKIAISKTPVRVETLIGSGLFDFGDKEGSFAQTLLQHPLGVAYHEGKIYIADTYNHKIKVADLQSGKTLTFLGNGKPGTGTSEITQLFEPGGLCWAGDQLFIADTNNHRIQIFDRKTNKVSVLSLNFSEYETREESPVFAISPKTKHITADQKIPIQGRVTVHFDFLQGYHLNPDAPAMVQTRFTNSAGKEFIGKKITPKTGNNQIEIEMYGASIENPVKVEIALNYYYCSEDKRGLCFTGEFLVEGTVDPQSRNIEIQVKVN